MSKNLENEYKKMMETNPLPDLWERIEAEIDQEAVAERMEAKTEQKAVVEQSEKTDFDNETIKAEQLEKGNKNRTGRIIYLLRYGVTAAAVCCLLLILPVINHINGSYQKSTMPQEELAYDKDFGNAENEQVENAAYEEVFDDAENEQAEDASYEEVLEDVASEQAEALQISNAMSDEQQSSKGLEEDAFELDVEILKVLRDEEGEIRYLASSELGDLIIIQKNGMEALKLQPYRLKLSPNTASGEENSYRLVEVLD